MERNNGMENDNISDDTRVAKARRKRQKRLLKNVCYEYAQSTSLQGIPYATRRGLTIIEKAFWLLTFIASLCMCGFLIWNVWVKWQTSPVIVTVSEQLVPVIKVPLPSVTICPQSKCKTSVYNYSAEMTKIRKIKVANDKSTNLTWQHQLAKFEDISLVCGDHKNSFWTYINMFHFQSAYHNSSVFKHLNEIALDYEDVFKACEISNRTVSCRKLFSKVVTSAGICYTMNSLAAEEIFRMENIQKEFPYLNSTQRSQGWSMEHGYDNDLVSNSSFYPDRGLVIGSSANVDILFGQDLEDHDKFCFGFNTGLDVYIQQPADLPQASLYSYTLLNDHISLLALSFSMMNTSETLKDYDPEIRQCYFPDERYLKYFKIYTASNCRIECLSNFTYQSCGCVQFYMPLKLTYRESDEEDSLCRCLPACNSVEYDAELLRNHHDFEQAMKVTGNSFSFKKNFSRTKFSRLRIFYKKPRFLSMRRSELFGMTDFLANCGGLLGLFLGFSFLSLVEIFYFFTLRICCALKQDLQKEKAHAKEKQDLNVKF